MYEDMTYEKILQRCLARVPNDLDRREGSVMYDALAPAARELAILYMNLSTQMDRAFPDTAEDIDLTNKAKERSVFRLPATPAVRRGVFYDGSGNPMAIPAGSRFSGGDLDFIAGEEIEPGVFRLTCETAGEAGNAYTGILFPIDHIEGLGLAELGGVLIYGEDEETDEHLRARYMASLEQTLFGGNVADYRSKTESIPGVGACKVYPVHAGGGTVKLVITSAGGGVPSAELIQEVQQTIDPPGYQGEGKGIAPIGHAVTVEGAGSETVNVSFTLTPEAGYTWAGLSADVTEAVEAYIRECVDDWADSERIIVRVARIESAALTVKGVLDISGAKINGAAANLTLLSEEIPVLGTVTNHAS